MVALYHYVLYQLFTEFRFVQGQTLEVSPEMMEAWQTQGALIIR